MNNVNRNQNMNLAQQNRNHAAMDGGAGGRKLNPQEMKEKVRDHFQNKVMKNNEYDVRVWNYVKDVPKVSRPIAYIAAFINVILPGFGTAIAAFAATSTSQAAVSKTQLSIALMQFLTTFALVGWIWSIYWGYLIVITAMQDDKYSRGGPAGAGGMGMGGGQQMYGDGGMDDMNPR